MSSNEGVNPNSPFIQQRFPQEETLFSPCIIISLIVAGVAATAFAVLAYLHILYPMSAYLAGGIAGSIVLFIAIRYCSRDCFRASQPPPPLIQQPTSTTSSSTQELPQEQPSTTSATGEQPIRRRRRRPTTTLNVSSIPIQRERLNNLPPVQIPQISNEQWTNFLNLPPQRANLIDGNEQVALASASGFMRIPYIGNYNDNYSDLRLSDVQWRLPPSQLTAFPKEMQQNFAQDAENGNLDIFFLATNRLGQSGARNFVMHPLVLPEYSNQQYPNGLVCEDVQMRIFDPHGIEQYQNLHYAIPFGNESSNQYATFHPSDNQRGTAISPNNARFVIQNNVDYCSFYLAARYRGRACACYVIINRGNEEDNVWQNVVDSSNTLHEFIETLSTSNFPYTHNVRQLLQRNQL